jgi:DNA-binding response OmpR family regulator
VSALILIADDEEALAKAMTLLLEEEGFRVRMVHDGRTALQQAMTLTPDLIITDIHMPMLNGVAMVRHLRAAGKSTPVILMSAIRVAAGMPGTTFVQKPFDIDDVLDLVRDMLSGPDPP